MNKIKFIQQKVLQLILLFTYTSAITLLALIWTCTLVKNTKN